MSGPARPAPAPRATAQDVGRSALRPLLTATITGWFIFTALAAISGNRPRTLVVDLCTALLTLLAREVIRTRPEWTRVAIHAACTVNLLGLVVTSWLAGGASGVGWTLLPALPLFAAHVEGRRVGWIWCGIAVLGCIAATTIDLSELDAPPSAAHHVVAGVWLIIICTSFAVLARREVEEHMQRVEAAAQARTDLMAAISHDVRTPLHAVLGITTVLSETDLEPDQRDLVERLAGTGRSLQRIVDDVLDTAQLEAGRFTVVPRPIDLLEVLEDVIDLHTPDAVAKGIALTLLPEGGDGFRVVGDDTRLKQVLSNLVANAVKFTPEGAVTVRARVTDEARRRHVEIRVEDSGPGIPADRIDRLFSRFDRLDTTAARLRAGTGLGLALSHDLAKLMGGSLEAERDRGLGAAFVLRLTLDAHPEPIASGELGGTVLVLETSEARAEAVRTLGACFTTYTIVVVSSCDAAVAQCRAGLLPDVVVVNAAVPDLLAARKALADAMRTKAPIVLAREPTGVVVEKRVSASFAGTTLLPLRRSRLARLLDEVMRSGARMALTHGTALVVDDDATNRKILEHVVLHRGWTASTAGGAMEALARLRERTFDVVLCDLNMPEVDGVGFVTRAKREGHRSFYVAATASLRPEDRERCLSAGFDAFLQKPLRLGEIDAILAKLGKSALSGRPLAPASASPRAPTPLPASRGDASAIFDETRWEQGRELMGAEHDDVVREHFVAAEGHVEAMEAKCEDASEVERRAHTLASGALGLGLAALGQAARALEQAAPTTSLEERRAATRRLAAILETTREAVHARRAGESGQGSIVEMRVVGELRREMLAQRIAAVMRTTPDGPLAVLADLTRMTEYETGVPEDLVDWLLANRARLVGFAFVSSESMLRQAAERRAQMTGLPVAAFEDLAAGRAWLDTLIAERPSNRPPLPAR
jgi:signal transduction histidine kinase/CheY-like chemotaxis protein